MNDIPEVCKESEPFIFADERWYFAYLTRQNWLTTLERDFKAVNLWLTNNKLTLNRTKTQIMFLSKRKTSNSETCHLDVDGHVYECFHECKYLGLTLDSKLNFDIHCRNLCRRLAQQCAIILRLKKIMHRKHLLMYYNVYIKSIIQYYGVLWLSKENTPQQSLRNAEAYSENYFRHSQIWPLSHKWNDEKKQYTHSIRVAHIWSHERNYQTSQSLF